MTKTKKEKEEARERAIAELRDFIKPGDTVFTVLTHVSSSGMSRRIKVLAQDGRANRNPIRDISWLVADALGYKWNGEGSVVVGGCGMDMGFHVVYSLSRVLFADSFTCIGEGCRSNDHTNDRDGSWSREKNKGRKHSYGGYAITHSWL